MEAVSKTSPTALWKRSSTFRLLELNTKSM